VFEFIKKTISYGIEKMYLLYIIFEHPVALIYVNYIKDTMIYTVTYAT
jgi:hypothetical protein